MKFSRWHRIWRPEYAPFDILPVAIENNELYTFETNWSDLSKFEMPETADTLPMMFATLPNFIARELGLERSEAPHPEVEDLENLMCLSNKCAISLSSGQTDPNERGLETVLSGKRPHSDSEVFRLEKRSLIQADSVVWPSSDVKEENVWDDTEPASSTLLPEAAKEPV